MTAGISDKFVISGTSCFIAFANIGRFDPHNPEAVRFGGLPRVVEAAGEYLVVYKPGGMHCAPLRGEPGGTLLDWCAARFPEVPGLRGRREGEGGLLHRLDYGTEGLVLLARDQGFFDALLIQQERGLFVKEYGALSAGPGAGLPGFPPRPGGDGGIVESGFRPYGPGRKAVRPAFPPAPGVALDRGGLYRSEITGVEETEGEGGLPFRRFRLRLCRGFRHQVRCHLAWLGFPIVNDGLYGGRILPGGRFALRAESLRFLDPRSGGERRCSLPPLSAQDIVPDCGGQIE
jgi:23S rRNA pseudouridine1911/1915/1917 synthase